MVNAKGCVKMNKMFEEYEDLLTVEETCEALRLGHNMIYSLLK